MKNKLSSTLSDKSDFKFKISMILIGSLITLTVLFVSTYSVIKKEQALQQEWLVLQNQQEPVRNAIYLIVYHAGYAGFIHDFKNYILRKEPIYLSRIYDHISIINKQYDELEILFKDRPELQQHLSAIETTLDKYFEKVDVAALAISNGVSTEALDQLVKVDDAVATQALESLKLYTDNAMAEMITLTNQQLSDLSRLSKNLLFVMIPIIILTIVGIWSILNTRKALISANLFALKAQEFATKAQASQEAQATFLANMSHEIRTPMNGVLGMLNLLIDTKLDSDQRHFVIQSRKSAENLLRIINDVLDISKIESGELTFAKNNVNIEQLIVDVGRLHESAAFDRGIELFCPGNPIQNCFVKADGVRLRQVLNNLLSNAIKFTDKGHVELIVEQELLDNKVQLNFRVSDTGCGIPSSDIEEIFSRFKQVDSSLTRRASGTGLGLAICAELILRMGGELKVSSRIGEGSQFSFSLVFELAEVLITNDFKPLDNDFIACFAHPKYQNYLSSLLVSWGMQCKNADNFSQLEDLAKNPSEHPAIAIIDSSLVTHDVFSVMERIKKNGYKVIMVNSLTQRNQKQQRQQYADASIVKPIAPSELYNAILEITGGRISDSQERRASSLYQLHPMSGHVLLVEDDIVNQEVASRLLSKFGLEVDIVENGQIAIEKLEQNDYSLILMDCMMPVMDGYLATKLIRTGSLEQHKKSIPIIALTANAMDGSAEQCLVAGMDDYISKPLDPKIFVEKLEKWLPK